MILLNLVQESLVTDTQPRCRELAVPVSGYQSLLNGAKFGFVLKTANQRFESAVWRSDGSAVG